MSLYYGTYVGFGYLVDEDERIELLADLIGTELYNNIMDYFHSYGPDKWFFGDKIYKFEDPEAKSIETLVNLLKLSNQDEFGIKYGAILAACNVPIEEINTRWAHPNFYIISWEDY